VDARAVWHLGARRATLIDVGYMRRVAQRAVLIVAVTALTTVSFATATAATGTWRIEPTTSASGWFNGVSCVGAAPCVAVGNDLSRPLIERFNGSAWSDETPAPDADANYLGSVSCRGPSFCMAVGSAGTGPSTPTAERWNGTTWAMTNPRPGTGTNNWFNFVSCRSASQCMAVGQQGVLNGPRPPLVEKWNGTKWAVQTVPAQVATGELSSISCVVASAYCLATGSQGNSISPTALVEQWSAGSWSVVTPPPVSGSAGVPSVSCVSATHCVAVVASPTADEAATWNGATWTLTPLPQVPAGDLAAIDCTSATKCVIAGQTAQQGTLIVGFNGSRWKTVPTPDTPPPINDALNAISCSGGQCTAVGSQNGGGALAITNNPAAP
jgi:hypothetical protein